MGGAVPHTPPLAVGGCAPPPPPLGRRHRTDGQTEGSRFPYPAPQLYFVLTVSETGSLTL